jgi:hypothetical protein
MASETAQSADLLPTTERLNETMTVMPDKNMSHVPGSGTVAAALTTMLDMTPSWVAVP